MMTQYHQNIFIHAEVIPLLWFHHYISGTLRFINLPKDKHTNSTQICLFLLREHAFPSKKNFLISEPCQTALWPMKQAYPGGESACGQLPARPISKE